MSLPNPQAASHAPETRNSSEKGTFSHQAMAEQPATQHHEHGIKALNDDEVHRTNVVYAEGDVLKNTW
jgi:hypothetical protein